MRPHCVCYFALIVHLPSHFFGTSCSFSLDSHAYDPPYSVQSVPPYSTCKRFTMEWRMTFFFGEHCNFWKFFFANLSDHVIKYFPFGFFSVPIAYLRSLFAAYLFLSSSFNLIDKFVFCNCASCSHSIQSKLKAKEFYWHQ